jgi:hypothetical protein
MNGKERKWAARDAADERRGNIPPKPQEIAQKCQCGKSVRVCSECPNDDLSKCPEACRKCASCFDAWMDGA